MKPIRIVKRKRNADRNEITTGTQKPDEPSASKIVNTVKSWIAESQERKRSQRRSLTALDVVISQQRGQATLPDLFYFKYLKKEQVRKRGLPPLYLIQCHSHSLRLLLVFCHLASHFTLRM